jgi:Flp pilus assembly protein TadD
MNQPAGVAGHVFISYVREDKAHVDRLQRALEAAEIPVWRDTHDLWPGQDWKLMIRRAISEEALVFIVCFSEVSLGKARSYQREELLLAIEGLRLRSPEQPWLIPVRFDDCVIPDRDIGAGRTLTSIQHADLFGATLYEQTARLVVTVRAILGHNQQDAEAEAETVARAAGQLLIQGKYSEAETTYRAALTLRPSRADLYSGLGAVLRMQGRPAEAETALREAIRLDPTSTYAHDTLGATLLDLARYREAETTLRESLRLNPSDAYAHSRLGGALHGLTRYGEAETSLRESLRLNPGDAYAQGILRMTLARKER